MHFLELTCTISGNNILECTFNYFYVISCVSYHGTSNFSLRELSRLLTPDRLHGKMGPWPERNSFSSRARNGERLRCKVWFLGWILLSCSHNTLPCSRSNKKYFVIYYLYLLSPGSDFSQANWSQKDVIKPFPPKHLTQMFYECTLSSEKAEGSMTLSFLRWAFVIFRLFQDPNPFIVWSKELWWDNLKEKTRRTK